MDIFAHGGSAVRAHELEMVFDDPVRYGKGLDWDNYSVHDAATCLLRYLKRLPDPVIPCQSYDKFTSIGLQTTEGELRTAEDEWVPEIRQIQLYIAELPPIHRHLLLYLLDLFAVIASKSDENKMTPHRLVAAFQPSLLAKDPSIGMSADDHRRASSTLVFMIENQDHFWIGMGGTVGDETETVIGEEVNSLAESELSLPSPTKQIDKLDTVLQPIEMAHGSLEDVREPEELVPMDTSGTNSIHQKHQESQPGHV